MHKQLKRTEAMAVKYQQHQESLSAQLQGKHCGGDAIQGGSVSAQVTEGQREGESPLEKVRIYPCRVDCQACALLETLLTTSNDCEWTVLSFGSQTAH